MRLCTDGAGLGEGWLALPPVVGGLTTGVPSIETLPALPLVNAIM